MSTGTCVRPRYLVITPEQVALLGDLIKLVQGELEVLQRRKVMHLSTMCTMPTMRTTMPTTVRTMLTMRTMLTR